VASARDWLTRRVPQHPASRRATTVTVGGANPTYGGLDPVGQYYQ
jgi:hypothetical protein